MKPIAKTDRTVVNIHTDTFTPFLTDDGEQDGDVLQANGGKTGFGFHVYRMTPGQTTVAHDHAGDEEFLLIEGDLTDHDGYAYKPGDLVCLKSGTAHNSHSQNGCLLAVYLPGTKDR
jgi:uncharacterized cupin superfamily protein